MRILHSVSYLLAGASLLSHGFAAPFVAFSEADLLKEIKHQENLFIRLMEPFDQAIEEGTRIVEKYHINYNGVKPDWYDGIVKDFISDNEKLYRAAEYTMVDDLISSMRPTLGAYRDLALKRGWTRADAAAVELSDKINEAIVQKDEALNRFIDPEDANGIGGTFWAQFRTKLSQWHQELPFSVRGEINHLLDSGRMNTNKDWLRWADEMYKRSKAPQPPVDFTERNPNNKKYVKMLHAKEILNLFSLLLSGGVYYQGVAYYAPTSEKHPRMLKNQGPEIAADRLLLEDQRRGLNTKLRRYLQNSKPQNFPLAKLLSQYAARPTGEDRVIPDLLRTILRENVKKRETSVTVKGNKKFELEHVESIPLDDEDDGLGSDSHKSYNYDDISDDGFTIVNTAANGIKPFRSYWEPNRQNDEQTSRDPFKSDILKEGHMWQEKTPDNEPLLGKQDDSSGGAADDDDDDDDGGDWGEFQSPPPGPPPAFNDPLWLDWFKAESAKGPFDYNAYFTNRDRREFNPPNADRQPQPDRFNDADDETGRRSPQIHIPDQDLGDSDEEPAAPRRMDMIERRDGPYQPNDDASSDSEEGDELEDSGADEDEEHKAEWTEELQE